SGPSTAASGGGSGSSGPVESAASVVGKGSIPDALAGSGAGRSSRAAESPAPRRGDSVDGCVGRATSSSGAGGGNSLVGRRPVGGPSARGDSTPLNPAGKGAR